MPSMSWFIRQPTARCPGGSQTNLRHVPSLCHVPSLRVPHSLRAGGWRGWGLPEDGDISFPSRGSSSSQETLALKKCRAAVAERCCPAH